MDYHGQSSSNILVRWILGLVRHTSLRNIRSLTFSELVIMYVGKTELVKV